MLSRVLSKKGLPFQPMGWSLIGLDEMARMRAYKASGGNIKQYYRKQREEKNKEERILELDQKVLRRIKNNYKAIDPDKMIEIPYTLKVHIIQNRSLLNIGL